MKENFPELNEKCCPVTDCEKAIRNSIKKCYPDMPLFRCWKHFASSTERWIREQGGDDKVVGFYSDALRELFLQPTKEAYEKLLVLKKQGYTNSYGNNLQAWSSSFIEYFDEYIAPEVDNLAAFSVRSYCSEYFNDFSGITTNQSEGLNKLLKDLQQNKELPLDTVILCENHRF